MADLRVKIGALTLQNPVLTASGTFGTGEELADFIDLNKLGAVVVKGVTLLPREGNPMPRIAECAGGMLNAIGLQNPGIDRFISEKTPFFEKFKVPFLVNISGYQPAEYGELAKRLEAVPSVAGIEVNVSCPNVRYSKGAVFAKDPRAVGLITRLVKKNTKKTVIIKLSPEVSDIKIIAKAAEDNGADALSLINTISGMAIDINTRRPKIKNIMGGLSGPAIKPVGIRCVWQVYNTVKIPLIGMGGIMNVSDAIEYLLAGATAVAVGTGNFINPAATLEIIDGLNRYMKSNKIKNIKELTGKIIL
ncbi:MAG: dihydroorotate dehydrogenase [Candidatus Firestonebacteria bacterium]|nr:dihydroorotate dehydrogenase [Candidatus Firestonebacteria bacterium]